MKNTKKMILAGLFLAVALVLPFLIGQIPQIGSMLSPMHIPVLICGFVCGWKYGLIIGLIAPLLRSVLFGMPELYPNGVGMAFEMAAYGACAGILYKILPKKIIYIYVSLVISMLVGRCIWGMAMYIMALLTNIKFNMEMFIAFGFVNAVPGIILHIAIIPIIVISLKKAGFVLNE